MQKNLVLFDFDGTLTTKDSLLVFFQFTHGKFHFYWNMFLSIPIIIGWKIGFLKAENGKNLIFNIFYKNWSKKKLVQAGQTFAQYEIPKILFPKAIDLIQSYPKKGNELALVSASTDVYLKPFCKQYQLECISTELLYENNIYTGKFKTLNCNKQEKVNRIKAIYEKNQFTKIIAYGNSSGDKAMMNWADESYFRYLG